MLTVDNLSLFKDNKQIFSQIGFSISSGCALIITGSNGSGKTSLLKIMAKIGQPTNGKILWSGQDINDISDDYLGDSQFLGHKNFLKQQLTVIQNLRFYTKLSDSEPALGAALQYFNLNDVANQKVKTLSAGWQQRVILAKLLACPSSIWFLDEPSTNLDKEGKDKLHNLITTRIKENGLVVMTTHDKMFFDLGVKINMEDFNQKTSQ